MSLCSNDDVFALLGNDSPSAAQTALMNILRPLAEDAVKAEVGYSIEQATHTHFLPGFDEFGGEAVSVDVLNGRVTFEYDEESSVLYLPERPIRSITTLYEDRAAFGGQGASDFPASSALTGGTDYYVDWLTDSLSWSGKLTKRNGTWSPKARTIKVTYVAGLTAGEIAGTTSCRGPVAGGVAQLRYAAISAAALKFKQPSGIQGTNVGPITAERLADYSVQYDGKSVAQLFGWKMDLPQELKDLLAPFKRRTV